MSKNSKIKRNSTFSDYIYTALVFIIAWGSLILILLPLLNVVACSFSSPDAILQGQVSIFPVKFTLMAYQAVFENERILRGFVNSIIIVIVGTVINSLVKILALTRCTAGNLPERNWLWCC